MLNEKLWKPGNYGDEYLGNITLRKALQLSRNVCTVRVLDQVGLDGVFELGGERLRIGYDTPACSRVHIPEDSDCKGTMSPSSIEGMAWCEWCDPESCSVVQVQEGLSCMDEPTVIDGEQYCHSCDVNLRLCDWLPATELPENDRCLDARLENGVKMCRSCDLSMGLGSSSLTMVELARAYSAFATYGHLVEPHFINRVLDRDGTVIEQWERPESWPQAIDPAVAGIAHWLLREVATGGTGARTNQLGIHVAGKTGTTNEFFDAWFVGYNTELITAAWVGYDKPRSIGVSFTGDKTALPIWMDFMREAAPKDKDKDFPQIPGVVFVPIDESTGKIATGGRAIPMLPGTAPEHSGGSMGQKSTEDLLTTDY